MTLGIGPLPMPGPVKMPRTGVTPAPAFAEMPEIKPTPKTIPDLLPLIIGAIALYFFTKKKG